MAKKKLSVTEQKELLNTLKTRFEENMPRHKGLKWDNVQAKLDKSPAKLWTLHQMESTGGEPDVVAFDTKSGEFVFYDCSPESPKERRSLCYDRAALDSRKQHKPKDSAMDMAKEMGVEMISEEEYRSLQETGEYDLKTSSWVLTPSEVRLLGGAIFCDRRFNRVFTYHNGAESYYGSRGFRGKVKV